MAEIRALGCLPQRVRGSEDDRVAERNLAKKLQHARIAGLLSADDEVELEGIGGAPRLDDAQELMEEIRALGRVPKQVRGTEHHQVAERNLAHKLFRKRVAKELTPAMES